MQCRQDDQVARPLLKYGVEVPDLEMMSHADQQRALTDSAARPHPGCDRDPPLAVHLRWCDETQPAAKKHVAGAAVRSIDRQIGQCAVMVGDAVAIIDQHARVIGM